MAAVRRDPDARHHGDLFPLPVPGVPRPVDLSDAPRYVAQRCVRRCCRERRVREAVWSLNQLAGDTVRGVNVLPRGAAPQEPNAAQQSVLRRLRDAMSAFSARPPGTTPNGALCELLKTDSLYAAPACKVENYDESKVKFLRSEIVPHPIVDVAPDTVRRAFLDPDNYIRKSDDAVERDLDGHVPIRPYWDERLRTNRAERIRFIKLLAEKGLVGYRLRIRARAGVFFVSKKGGMQRLVIDARETNRMHYAPPHAALGTPGALADQDWSDEVLSRSGAGDGDPGGPFSVYGASLDLRDSFYQFYSDEMAEDFGFDFPEQAAVWGVSTIWSRDGPVAVQPEQELFPVFRGVPMGWSWALWAVHSTVAHWTAEALGSPARLVMDRLPPPTPSSGRPTASVYVDNVVVLGLTAADANDGLSKVRRQLHALGLATHEEEEATCDFDVVGVRCEGRLRRLRATDAKAWRLYLACQAMESGIPRAAWQVRVFLGHCIQHCLLMRPAMCCFRELYAFVDNAGLTPVVLPLAARREVRLFKGLVFLAIADLAAPTSCEVFCSDASEAGYGLHVARVPSVQVRELAQYRERWRFVPEEKRPFVSAEPTYTPGWEATRTEVLGAPLGPELTAVWEPIPRGGKLGPRIDDTHQLINMCLDDYLPGLPDSLLEPHRWALVVEGAWAAPAPIHVLEGRIALTGLRRAARTVANHGCRVLSLGDNMSELLSAEKGRAVDAGLGSICRRACAYQVASGIRWRRRHVDTKRNVSDAASRKALRGRYQPGERRVGPGGRHRCRGASPLANAAKAAPGRVQPPPALGPRRLGRHGPRSSASGPSLSLPLRRPAKPLGRNGLPRSARAAPLETLSEPFGPLLQHPVHPPVRHLVLQPVQRHALRHLPVQHPVPQPVQRHAQHPVPRPAEVPPTAPADAVARRTARPAPRAPSRQPQPRAALEIFSGCGRWSGALLQRGLRVGAPIDIKNGAWCDMLNGQVESVVRRWITGRKLWFIHFGTPCTPWSVAKGGKRSPADRAALRCARVTMRLLQLCVKHHVHWSIENPYSSGLFRWAPLHRFLVKYSRASAVYDCCAFGATYQKPTRVDSSLPDLDALARPCPGGHAHEHLQGTVRIRSGSGLKTVWKTTLAGAYPPGVCHLFAELLVPQAPAGARSDGPAVLSSEWEAELRRAAGDPAEPCCPTPKCPRRWTPLWPSSAPSWGGGWGRWIPPRAPHAADARRHPSSSRRRGGGSTAPRARVADSGLSAARQGAAQDPGKVHGCPDGLRGHHGHPPVDLHAPRCQGPRQVC